MKKNEGSKVTALSNTSNDAAPDIGLAVPYVVEVSITGVAPLLFHRWSCDAVEEKSKAAKGSKAKRSDNVESYVYRDDQGTLALPGEYLRQSILMAAKFRQDPRSPRKSAFDLYKAGVVAITDLASLGAKEWDYLDRRRVVVQRNAITRERPAMRAGWSAIVQLQVLLPEYIDEAALSDVLTNAGRLVGLGDFRPTFGRVPDRQVRAPRARQGGLRRSEAGQATARRAPAGPGAAGRDPESRATVGSGGDWNGMDLRRVRAPRRNRVWDGWDGQATARQGAVRRGGARRVVVHVRARRVAVRPELRRSALRPARGRRAPSLSDGAAEANAARSSPSSSFRAGSLTGSGRRSTRARSRTKRRRGSMRARSTGRSGSCAARSLKSEISVIRGRAAEATRALSPAGTGTSGPRDR